MPSIRPRLLVPLLLVPSLLAPAPRAAAAPDLPLERWKQELAEDVERRAPFTADMVDQIFSFGELGFQEYETSRYLTGILRDNGFEVREGIAGIPTAWVATWGSGKPVISLGTDVDDVPKASQVPGVACRKPLVEGAPGHGEGHNAGQPLNITAALAVKALMEREGLPGTIQLWPGIAEEQLGAKAHYVRAGLFDDVDIVLYNHVGTDLGTGWGITPGLGLVSAIFTFEGEAAHAGSAPWRGRSALDAALLMEVGWNFRREHLRPQQRSHAVLPDGGDQPNVVPPSASVWYYFREKNFPEIQDLFETGQAVARGAAMMAGTELAGVQVVGSAWPGHFNRTIAETMYANIRAVGLPDWSDADQTLAKATQRYAGAEPRGLVEALAELPPALTEAQRNAGYADDIGDVSWNVPTAVLRFPANIPGLPFHNWIAAVAMATPIAHKGVTAGAKVQAMTLLDFMVRPELVEAAWDYFENVQTEALRYEALIRPDDEPATWMNADIMAEFRPAMREHYFDPERYDSYLEQLGVEYPTLPGPDGACAPELDP